MAASHMAASILMRSSTKMVAIQMPAVYCKVSPSGPHTLRKAEKSSRLEQANERDRDRAEAPGGDGEISS